MKRLDGKVAIITGGATGMGATHAEAFVAEGAQVMLADVRDEDGRRVADALGSAARYSHLDVTNAAAWPDVVASTVEAFGPPTVLVNNAGITAWGSVVEEEVESFRHMLDVNLVGTWLGIKAVAEVMIAAGGGSIVNVSSDAGMRGFGNLSAYVSSKWGVRGLTRSAAVEFGHRGIRVNAVLPGLIDTPMGIESIRGADPAVILAGSPIPRIGRPEEVTAMIVFLASDESSYCTGADFLADGGMLAGTVSAWRD